MRILLTGHTGFKGSWLTLMLKKLGTTVGGYSIGVPEAGLYQLGSLSNVIDAEVIGDVREAGVLQDFFQSFKPEIAVHFAAQPLVLDSYIYPEETFTTNVVGTLNFLRQVSDSDSCRLALVITTDKVYKPKNTEVPHIESDQLGGDDPYSASKAMADLLSQSWANLESGKKILIARAGNVIGAFDSSKNRLIPDINRAIRSAKPIEIRNPLSVRPWQHVLDCLGGYLSFISHASVGSVPRILNFGPNHNDFHTVQEVVEIAKAMFPELEIMGPSKIYDKENSFLALDSSAANQTLGWKNLIGFEESVRMSLGMPNVDPVEIAKRQIEDYLSKNSDLELVSR